MSYRPKDYICMPVEPPVGTVIRASDGSSKFLMVRRADGWAFKGKGGTRARFDWRVICDIWLPAMVVSLPEEKT